MDIIAWLKGWFLKGYTRNMGAKTPYDYTIRDWQRRELATGVPKNDLYPKNIDMTVADNFHKCIMQLIPWKSDQEVYGRAEFWATSDEVLKRREDDCDGQAVARFRFLLEAGFPPDKIGLMIIDGHMQCCIHEVEHDPWILDNGYLNDNIVLATQMFPVTKRDGTVLRPLYGFNLHDVWRYEKNT